ncbi:hypothetical protein P4R82_10280 [Marinivivus vitaminiproducens]|nr:hypothetical protein P4R82_10280 [Geminicoccaceae bacterium SCSIO 64248]
MVTVLAAITANASWTMPAGQDQFMATNASFAHLGLVGGFILAAMLAQAGLALQGAAPLRVAGSYVTQPLASPAQPRDNNTRSLAPAGWKPRVTSPGASYDPSFALKLNSRSS